MSIRYIRETVIRDIVDLLGAIKDGDDATITSKLSNKKVNKYSSSISKSSKDLIMTFPVICSNTIDPKTAGMVSKAIERKCVTMLQLLFSAVNVTDSQNVTDYIRKFHTNINLGGMSVDDVLSISDELAGDIRHMFESGLIEMIKEDMKNLPNERVLSDSINENSLQQYKIIDNQDRLIVVSELGVGMGSEDIRKAISPNDDINAAKDKREIRKSDSTTTKYEFETFNKQLMDSDVKKCNEMVPSLLIINLNIVNHSNESIKTSAVIGVKTRLIATDSFDIIDKIYSKHSDSNLLLKLIRATTREISFCKDFLFGVDKAKVDVLSKSKKGSKLNIWKTLERRSIKSNINKALKRSNNANAITSLVLSQDEVDYLYKNYNIKLEDVGTAKNLLNKYNLLSVIIVDETIEVVKFMYDGEDSFETLSFSSLERESEGGMYKKVLNLMSKMNR